MASRAGSSLLKVLGVAFGVAVIVGNTIGTGIVRTPGDIAAALPRPALYLGMWVAGGAWALLAALTTAELGAMIPRSGGQYVFARRALGEYPGFVVGWSDWISSCASLAAGAIAIGEFSGGLAPALAGRGAATAAAVVLGFTALQWIGVRTADRTQQAVSLLKTLALAGLVAVCFALPHETPAPAAAALLPVGLPLLTAVVVSLQGVIFTYDGWNGMLYFSGEVREPGRDIPRAMAGGVVVVMAVYVALNLAFLHVLPLARMAHEPLVAGAAAAAILGPRGDLVLRAIMIVSLLGAANAILMISSRVPYAMGADRLAPAVMARVNAGGTPTVALLASAAVALALLLTGTFATVLALAAFFFVLNYAASFASLFVLRWREPGLPRPYRAVGYPWVAGLLLLNSVAFLVANVVGDTRNSLRSLALLAFSYPVFLGIRWRRRVVAEGR